LQECRLRQFPFSSCMYLCLNFTPRLLERSGHTVVHLSRSVYDVMPVCLPRLLYDALAIFYSAVHDTPTFSLLFIFQCWLPFLLPRAGFVAGPSQD
jgi:hypothetical protein